MRCEHDVITMTSPARFADSPKNQDRAAWYPATNTACVADGTSSSPCAAQAAEMVVAFARVGFLGSTREWLRALSECLFALRQGELRNPPKPPADCPESMREWAQEAARRLAAQSFQTTCVAACVQVLPEGVDVQMLRVGDSSILIFDERGELAWPRKSSSDVCEGAQESSVSFGDRVIVRILDTAAIGASDLDRIRPPESKRRDVLCRLVRNCSKSGNAKQSPSGTRVGDLLAVPAHYLGAASPVGLYRLLPYARSFRVVRNESPSVWPDPFADAGTITHVLPDSFVSSHWSADRAHFPVGSHVVLASDGFTRCFANADAVWQWLNRYAPLLRVPDAREPILDALHAELRDRVGDDDISLVWIRPVTRRCDTLNSEVSDG